VQQARPELQVTPEQLAQAVQPVPQELTAQLAQLVQLV
jgi:hypothetical protein